MEIYLPVADVHVNIFIIIGLGLVVGFFSGLLGIGGGIILNPTLIKLGIPPIVTVGTSVAQMVGATVSGFLAHLKLKNIDLKLGTVLVISGFFGGGIGVFLTKILEEAGYFRTFVLSFYAFYLAFTGITMFMDILKKERENRKESRFKRFMNSLPLKYRFEFGEFSILIPVFIGIVSGFLAAVMGVGGGFVVIPALMYLAGLPVQKAVGMSLFQMIFITAFLTYFHGTVNHGVDIVLALILMAGSSFGAVFGSAVGQRINKNITKLIMASLVSLVSVLSFYQLFFEKEKPKGEVHLVHNPISEFAYNQPELYSILVIVVSLIAGTIISMVAHRLKILIEVYLEKLKHRKEKGKH
ncbi:sulfite exporter TauE/SafE family protein [Persephonella sp.]